MKRALMYASAAFACAAGIALAMRSSGLASSGPTMTPANFPIAIEGNLPPISGATGWINSEPLSATALRGRVVVIEFWTYTCINWRRTLPYVRAWADRYRSEGLIVVGVHTPEFGFERDADNVRRAIAAMRMDFPVAMDNDYAIWRAFHNNFWPALYFVDARGHIRHHQYGEGDYEQSETLAGRAYAQSTRNRPLRLSACQVWFWSAPACLATRARVRCVTSEPRMCRALSPWTVDCALDRVTL